MTVYADNAATTRMSRTALDAMLPAMEENYGNPSSLHHVGQAAAEALLQARQDIAGCLGCTAREIYFTSGGSEADNQALRSAAYAGAKSGKKHLISTAIEHHAILHTLKQLEEEGFSVTLLPEPGFHRFPIFSGGMNDCLTVLCLFFSCIALILLDDQRF